MIFHSITKVILPASLHRKLVESAIVKRILGASLWVLAGTAVSRILILISMIVVARVLGKEQFGELGIIQSTLGVAGIIAGSGIGNTGTRFIAQYAACDPTRTGRIIGLLQLVSAFSIIFTSLFLVMMAEPLASRVLGSMHLEETLRWGVLLMMTNALRVQQVGVLAGIERFDVIAKLNVLEGVIAFVVVIAGSQIYGVVGALIGLAVGAGCAWLTGVLQLQHMLKEREIRVDYRKCYQEWSVLTGYSIPGLLTNLISTPVLWYCLTLVARSKEGYAGVAMFVAAYQWHGPLIMLPLILMSTSIPIMVQEWSAGNLDRFRRVIKSLVWIALAMTIPPALVIAVMSPRIMELYGVGFNNGWFVLVLLVIATPFHAISKIYAAALLGMNKAWHVFGLSAVWGCVLVVLVERGLPEISIIGLAASILGAYIVLTLMCLLLVRESEAAIKRRLKYI